MDIYYSGKLNVEGQEAKMTMEPDGTSFFGPAPGVKMAGQILV